MPYTYKFLPPSMASKSQKDLYVDLFQETLNNQFYNSSNWWTIEEETEIGSGEYQEVDVRIAHVINAETGLNLGDDWKTLLFKDVNHDIEIGKRFIFDENTWLTVNIEVTKNLTGTCTIRRCNNSLRWIDESTGVYYEEPCWIDYVVKEPRDYATSGSPFITPGGFLHIEAQLNDNSNRIKENQRFLFGNTGHWTCYKVVGTGVNNYKNTETYVNDSAKILTLDMVANFVNTTLDDVTNGIADVYTNVYTLSIDRASAEGEAGETLQLRTKVTYNGNMVTNRTIDWSTSNAYVATVSSSGVVTFNAVGTCTITAALSGSPAISTTCSIATKAPGTAAVNNDIVISPSRNYVLEGVTQAFTVYLYKDGVVQADVFTVTCNRNSVPTTSYTFTQTGDNSFSITNTLRNLSSYLTITCTTGTPEISKTLNVYLRGAWLYDNK